MKKGEGGKVDEVGGDGLSTATSTPFAIRLVARVVVTVRRAGDDRLPSSPSPQHAPAARTTSPLAPPPSLVFLILLHHCRLLLSLLVFFDSPLPCPPPSPRRRTLSASSSRVRSPAPCPRLRVRARATARPRARRRLLPRRRGHRPLNSTVVANAGTASRIGRLVPSDCAAFDRRVRRHAAS